LLGAGNLLNSLDVLIHFQTLLELDAAVAIKIKGYPATVPAITEGISVTIPENVPLISQGLY
jgi:hypothetical protein